MGLPWVQGQRCLWLPGPGVCQPEPSLLLWAGPHHLPLVLWPLETLHRRGLCSQPQWGPAWGGHWSPGPRTEPGWGGSQNAGVGMWRVGAKPHMGPPDECSIHWPSAQPQPATAAPRTFPRPWLRFCPRGRWFWKDGLVHSPPRFQGSRSLQCVFMLRSVLGPRSAPFTVDRGSVPAGGTVSWATSSDAAARDTQGCRVMAMVRMWFLLCICNMFPTEGPLAQQTVGCCAETTERGPGLPPGSCSKGGPGAVMPPAHVGGHFLPPPPLMKRPKPGEQWGPALCWPPPPPATHPVLRLQEGRARAGGEQALPPAADAHDRLPPSSGPHRLSLPQAWSWHLREEVGVPSLAPATVLARNTCFQPRLK